MGTSVTGVAVAVSGHSQGVVIRLHVQPGARRTAVSGLHGERLRVAVAEAPEKGRATEAVLRLVADRLQLPVAAVSLLRGATARQKDVLVTGLSLSEVTARLQAEIGSA